MKESGAERAARLNEEANREAREKKIAALKAANQCTRPDRHEPKLLCGWPLPCPWHSS